MAKYSQRKGLGGSSQLSDGSFVLPFMPLAANFHDKRTGLDSIFAGAEKQHEKDVWVRQFQSRAGDPVPGVDNITLCDHVGNPRPGATITIGGRDYIADQEGRVRLMNGEFFNKIADAEEERRAYCKRIARWCLTSDEIAVDTMGLPGFCALLPWTLTEQQNQSPPAQLDAEALKHGARLNMQVSDPGFLQWVKTKSRQIFNDMPSGLYTIDARPSTTTGLAPTTTIYQEKVMKLLECIKRSPCAVIAEQPAVGEAPAVITPASQSAKSLGGSGGSLKAAVS